MQALRPTALCVAAAVLLWGVAAPRAAGQGLTGQIAGTVVDSSGSVLPGAAVTVQNVSTRTVREAVTDGTGTFVVTDLLAGTYDVSISLAGFKTTTLSGVVLSANERLALRTIALDVGELAETVSVSGAVARVQTQSGERSGVIAQDQLEDITLKGRDYMGMLKLVPGVVDTANREAPGWNNLGGLSINGGRTNTINLTYDGVTNLDTGSNTGPFLAPGLDSIAEIKILTSNYQAEYGRSSGGTINVVTKSGSQSFRGGGFYSKRDEAMNANEWQNNRFGTAKPPYRFDYTGYHVGGPITWPGFNQNRSQAVLLLEPGVPAPHQPGHAAAPHVPDRARAQRRLLAVVRRQRRAARRPRSADGPAVPRQRHPGQPHRSERPGAA